ncbi:hypothetical protein BBM1454_10410 [Bifidobacterium breve MCC 1454]|nr:hypothetical protein BBM1454_10410 [Bifidobacterium breve MCC 1454]
MLVDVRGHQRRAGSSLAAKKADAVVKISFARRNSAFSVLSFFSSAIASSADCLVSSATVASDWLRQRRSDSGAIPRSFATAAIAFVSDEYEERDSTSSLTAFALNSGIYQVPFATVSPSPNQLEEMRNKNQSISSRQVHVDQGFLDALLAPPVAFDHRGLEQGALEFRRLQLESAGLGGELAFVVAGPVRLPLPVPLVSGCVGDLVGLKRRASR